MTCKVILWYASSCSRVIGTPLQPDFMPEDKFQNNLNEYQNLRQMNELFKNASCKQPKQKLDGTDLAMVSKNLPSFSAKTKIL